jgi:hypothetical protein
MVIMTKLGRKDNPLIKHETTARAFVVRTLCRLGLNVEPIRGPGRPSPGFGITETWEG